MCDICFGKFIVSDCNPWNNYSKTLTFTDNSGASRYVFIQTGNSYGSFINNLTISRSGTTVTATVTFDYTGFNNGVHTGGIYGYIIGFKAL